jgi:hypothetical protein
MTEREWLGCTDPMPMLEFLLSDIVTLVDDLPSEAERRAIRGYLERDTVRRKLALFAFACCRLVWDEVADGRSREAIETAERYIDGLASRDQLNETSLASHHARNSIGRTRGADRAKDHVRRVAANACWAATSALLGKGVSGEDVMMAAAESADVAVWAGLYADPLDARTGQAQLLRCVVSNPFQPIAFDPAWRTQTAVAITRGMYDGRDFAAMPILADALQDAGCEHEGILDHCRKPGEHVRGCWVVDLVLGME